MCISNLMFYAQSTIAVISGQYIHVCVCISNLVFYAQSTIISGQHIRVCVLVTWCFMPSQPLQLYQGDICVY